MPTLAEKKAAAAAEEATKGVIAEGIASIHTTTTDALKTLTDEISSAKKTLIGQLKKEAKKEGIQLDEEPSMMRHLKIPAAIALVAAAGIGVYSMATGQCAISGSSDIDE